MRCATRTKVVAFAAVALLISGCKVGPDYKIPEAEMPSGFGSAVRPPSTQTSTQPTTRTSYTDPNASPWINWWTKFGDAELDSLVKRAVAANHELKIAASRVQQARAVQRIAESRRYPTLDFSGSVGRVRGSSAGFGFPYGEPGKETGYWEMGFDASYEVDLFGGVGRSIEAAGAFAAASEADRRAVHVTLLGEVARSYINLRALQRRLAVAQANLEDQRRTLDVVQRQFKNGLATDFDVVRASAQVAATESAIPALQSGIRQTIHGIAVLLGEQPQALSNELLVAAPIPPVPPTLPVGLPSELLRRRPDIIRSERVLAAVTAEQGVATSELFPRLILGGAAGVQSQHADQLFDQHQPSAGFYAAGPMVDYNIFDGGRRRANIDRSKAQVAAALSAYEATILGAMRDVENSLTAYSHDQTRRDTLQTLVARNEDAVRIARTKYRSGIINLLDVLEVQRNLYVAQDSLAQADQAISSDMVSLYKALGGGWESTVAPTTQASQQPK